MSFDGEERYRLSTQYIYIPIRDRYLGREARAPDVRRGAARRGKRVARDRDDAREVSAQRVRAAKVVERRPDERRAEERLRLLRRRRRIVAVVVVVGGSFGEPGREGSQDERRSMVRGRSGFPRSAGEWTVLHRSCF